MTYEAGAKFQRDVFVMGTSVTDYPIDKLVEILKAADDLFTNDEQSFLEDSEYDSVRMIAHRMDPANPYFTSVGSSVRGGKIKLPFTMGSLDQVQVGELNGWKSSNHLTNKQFIVSDKEDGGSNMIRYANGKLQIAYSRGDGTMGADITRHLKHIQDVPHDLPDGMNLTVRCEHIISRKAFKALNVLGARRRGGAPYKNPRNMVAGLMNSSENDPKYYKHISVIAYEIVGSVLSKSDQLDMLSALGFSVVPWFRFEANQLTETEMTKHLETRRAESDFEIDGLVIEVNDVATRMKMANPGSLNPGYAVKFKVADASNFAIATVKDVEWNVSKDGYYKPRVVIHPVDLVGVTIKHLTAFNAKFVIDNKINIGAKIKITRSGDVIPFILGVEEPADEGAYPEEDNAVWNATGVDLMVADTSNNSTVKFQRLWDFFLSIDVPHLGEGHLRTMFDLGLESPEEIINMSQQDIIQAIGSSANGKKIFTGMRAKFTNIPLYVLMGSHSCFGRGVGKRKMKKLYEAWDGDMTMCQTLDHITNVAGFDTKTAVKIQAGYPAFIKFLTSIEGNYTLEKFVGKKQGSLSGKTFIFTGFRDAGLEKQIIDQGGAMGTAVSSKTSYLVTAEANSTSTKAKAAQAKGVAVIGLEELKRML